MSNSSSCDCSSSSNTAAGGVLGTPYLGGHLLQVDDFFQYASILHPFAVGSIAIIALYGALRFSSNRSVAPMTVFDWIVNVALGSTLAGVVNGNSLVRGLIGLIVLLGWQFLTSFSSSRFGHHVRKALNSPPLVIVFRGRKLEKVMKRHRINSYDLAGALRGAGVWQLSEVEACILEPTGVFSIYKSAEMPGEGEEADILLAVPAYKALVDGLEEGNRSKGDLQHGGKKKDDKDQRDSKASNEKATGEEEQKSDTSSSQESRSAKKSDKPNDDKNDKGQKGDQGCTEEQNDVAEQEA